MDQPKRILIGCPVRDRAWILPRYLESLAGLDYPPENIEYVFVVNDSTDNTFSILQQFSKQQVSPVHLIAIDFGNRRSADRGGYSINYLVKLRNILLETFLNTKCSHLFSVDSDILVKPHTLQELLKLDLPIVSSLVRNDWHLGDKGFFNILRKQDEHLRPITEFTRDQLIRVDCTGAAYLISRMVVDDMGVRYHPHLQGEDAGFCEDARSKDITIWCHTGLECTHVMQRF
ncbi:MAG: glycosyltransferase [Ignavibacteriales bacterium]